MHILLNKIVDIRKYMIARQTKISLISVFAAPWLLLLLAEACQRGSLVNALIWFGQAPDYAFWSLFFIFLCYIILLMVSSNPCTSFLTMALPLAFCTITSFNKMTIRELPLLPWNMLLLDELVVNIAYSPTLLVLSGIVCVIAVLVIIIILYLFGGIKTGLKLRIRLLSTIISAILIVLLFMEISKASLSEGPVKAYQKLGFIPTLSSYFAEPYMKTPAGYSEDAVKDILEHMEKNKINSVNAQQLPNIVFVIGEAFWDPTLLKNVSFSQDPVPNLHNLQKRFITGTLQVNPYGGNTTATEFESMTGLSMSFMAPDTTAYSDFLETKIPSLPAHLTRIGYKTEELFPNNKKSINRNIAALKYLGFNSIISDTDFINPKKTGYYISDYSTGEKIVELFKLHNKTSPQIPYFLFTVTAQNHFDYNLDWYKNTAQIKVKAPDSMNSKEAALLTGYIQGVHDTDKLLGRLTEYFSSQESPVILVFFGDHLPALGQNRSIYFKGGLISGTGTDYNGFSRDILKLHTVPFIIWDNFSGKKKNAGTISAPYLQTVLSDEYNLPKSPFQAFLSSAMKKQPTLGLSAWPQTLPAGTENIISQYQILQYYYLFGK
jgi:glucan phosphoethanolaminetransferase (alkaline phosphatase superfamily)